MEHINPNEILAPSYGDPYSSPFRILIVDDDLSTNHYISHILTQNGLQTHQAYDVNQAINSFKENPFHLIVMDYDMPDMNGVQASELIQQISEMLNAKTKIIGLSGMPEYYMQEHWHNADAYLSKPINEQLIIQTIRTLCSTDNGIET